MPIKINPRYAMMYFGEVKVRNDPKGIGRVKVRIPGLISQTGFAFPAGQEYGGAAGQGSIAPPPLGATVLVGFAGANPDRPFYFAGPWRIGGAPAGHEVTADGDNKVFADERIVIERDARVGKSGYRITDRATGGARLTLELDIESQQVQIIGNVGVLIKSSGAIRIEGATITLGNRVVLPTGKEI